jgi:hypothetical protein
MSRYPNSSRKTPKTYSRNTGGKPSGSKSRTPEIQSLNTSLLAISKWGVQKTG